MRLIAVPIRRALCRVGTTIRRLGRQRVAAGALTVLAVGLAARRPWSGDLGIHAATVDALRHSLTHPGNPLVDADTSSPYYSPYTVLLALVARLTGLSAVAVLWCAGPVVVALWLWGLRAFVRTLTDRRLAPTLALVFVLLLWGVRARVWSGFLSLYSLPLVMAFPSTVALGLTLLLWAGLATARRWPAYAGLGALAALIALVHPFTAVTAGLGALAIAVWRGRTLGRAAWVAPATAVVPVLAWPYWSFVALLRQGGELDAIHRALYDRPWEYYGLVVVALPALWLRARRDRRDPLVLLFASAALVVALGWLTGRYALGRVWPAVLLSAQLALAVELAGAGALSRRAARIWCGATALACLAGLAVQAGNLLYLAPPSMLTPRVRHAAHMYVAWPDYSWLPRYVRPGDVVLTPDDYFATRTVPAYGGRTVAPAWPDPFLPDQAQRERDLVTMRDPATDPAARAALLARYHVRWALDLPFVTGAPPVATGPQGQRLYTVP
jgi:alpha-1,6-mannosyltransferase